MHPGTKNPSISFAIMCDSHCHDPVFFLTARSGCTATFASGASEIPSLADGIGGGSHQGASRPTEVRQGSGENMSKP